MPHGELIASKATTTLPLPLSLYNATADKLKTTLDTTANVEVIAKYTKACEVIFTDNSELIAEVIDSPCYLTIAQSAVAMGILCQRANYVTAMLSNRNWVISLLTNNSGSAVFTGNITCLNSFSSTYVCIQEMSKLIVPSNLATALFASTTYVDTIKQILNNTAYFTQSSLKSIQAGSGSVQSDTDITVIYTPSRPTMIIGSKITCPYYTAYNYSGPIYRLAMFGTRISALFVSSTSYDASGAMGTANFSLSALVHWSDNRRYNYQTNFTFYEYVSRA